MHFFLKLDMALKVIGKKSKKPFILNRKKFQRNAIQSLLSQHFARENVPFGISRISLEDHSKEFTLRKLGRSSWLLLLLLLLSVESKWSWFPWIRRGWKRRTGAHRRGWDRWTGTGGTLNRRFLIWLIHSGDRLLRSQRNRKRPLNLPAVMVARVAISLMAGARWPQSRSPRTSSNRCGPPTWQGTQRPHRSHGTYWTGTVPLRWTGTSLHRSCNVKSPSLNFFLYPPYRSIFVQDHTYIYIYI